MPSDDGGSSCELSEFDTSSQSSCDRDLEETRRRSDQDYTGDDLSLR